MITAKFSRALIRRIYEHAFAEGWLAPGMTVLDPFAGVALGALDAMWNGLNWVGVELEPKFCALAEKNIEFWQRKYGSKEGFGTARIIQGDSRKLAEVIQGADLVCSSPPYEGSMNSEKHGIDWAKAKKDYPGRVMHEERIANQQKHHDGRKYGDTKGQLGSMKEGDFDCVVGSPPFSSNPGATAMSADRKRDTSNPKKHGAAGPQYISPETPGQLASLPEGRFEAVIGSPPWEKSMVESGDPNYSYKFHGSQKDYGNEVLNIGNQSGPTFWSAARDILVQCHAILKPGGHAIWVTKRFVRAGKIVEFSDQWLALCESQGFTLCCRHRAMLVKLHGSQDDIFGGTKELKTERESFFRRLHEKRPGAQKIDWEDILCLVKN